MRFPKPIRINLSFVSTTILYAANIMFYFVLKVFHFLSRLVQNYKMEYHNIVYELTIPGFTCQNYAKASFKDAYPSIPTKMV